MFLIMIEITIPVEKIPYIRTIEGRKFRNGKWQFPDSAIETLKKYFLVSGDYIVEKKTEKRYEMSPHLYEYQKEIVNKALNKLGFGIFSDTGTGKCCMSLEIAKHLGKTLI